MDFQPVLSRNVASRFFCCSKLQLIHGMLFIINILQNHSFQFEDKPTWCQQFTILNWLVHPPVSFSLREEVVKKVEVKR